ncbi:MAG: kynurenine--oxoglutarate transaminase/cysteine-S-conjugate beta-lyase [Bacteriovoracaceae bacterium]|jgi:kynurenine--oxoglutarate transaminase/cysteine-S-conjugate beta-lyase/glutamine--phenylpyruvate transaminase
MNISSANRIKSFEAPSVWLEFSPLAQATNSINLGQGFPDWAPPSFLQNMAIESIQGVEYSTYARSAGHLNLTKSISKNYSEQLNKDINPLTDVLVTVGASEALFLSIMSFINEGDEVITIEPAFDIYYGALAMAKAKTMPVSLIPSKDNLDSSADLVLDWDTLKKNLSLKTKAIILNTPHNPSGKVFSKVELETLADILKEYPQCLIIADEVYEHIVYDDNIHIPIASLPGMFERTISIYSAGKTFSVTGWKIGWAIGPKELIRKLQLTQQWVVFSVSTPHQQAISEALNTAKTPYKNYNNYYDWLKEEYTRKREILFNGLNKAGLNPILPQGSFFILCDIKDKVIETKVTHEKLFELTKDGSVQVDNATLDLQDYNFSRHLSFNKNVTSIPASAFHIKENQASSQGYIRFAFCKEDDVLKKAIRLLN